MSTSSNNLHGIEVVDEFCSAEIRFLHCNTKIVSQIFVGAVDPYPVPNMNFLPAETPKLVCWLRSNTSPTYTFCIDLVDGGSGCT